MTTLGQNGIGAGFPAAGEDRGARGRRLGAGLLAAAGLCVGLAAGPAGAANILWEGGPAGDFEEPANWANGDVPMLPDTAVLNSESSLTLSFSSDRTIARLLHTVGGVVLDLNTRTLRLAQVGSLSPSLTTGSPSDAGTSLRVDNGRLVCEWASLADSISQFSELILDTPDADFESEVSTWVGAFGQAVLRVVNMGFAGIGEDLIVGQSRFGSGIVVVEDEGSLVDVVDQLQVGSEGDASVFIRKGGEVSCRDAFLGAFEGSDGLLQAEDPGSLLEVLGSMGVGFEGAGELVVTDGATARCLQARVGFSESSQGTVLVRNPGSLFEVSGQVIVGVAGAGELRVLDGGVATFNELSVDSTSATTSVVVSGSGALLAVTEGIQFGTVINQEPVVFRVDTGGTLQAGGVIAVGEFGLLDVTDATVSASAVEVGNVGVTPVRGSAAGGASRGDDVTGLLANGVIDADVTNGSGGVVRPRPDFTELGVAGSYTQLLGGTLELVVDLPITGGGVFSSLAASGPASLGGTLRVIESGSANSPLGERFPVLTASSVSGTFDDAELPENTSSRRYVLVYGPDRVELVATVNGDTDGDLDVDSADLGALLAAWGTSSPNEDYNDDGVVDTEDLGTLLAEWGGAPQ